MPGDVLNLWSLFFSAFISATLLPGGSEAVLVILHQTGQYSASSLLFIATLGNTLGGMTSYALGRVIVWRYPSRTWSGQNPSHHIAIARIKKWGSLILLFSWVPIIGDPLCVAAGYLRIHPILACVLFAMGKLLRYLFVLWISVEVSTP